MSAVSTAMGPWELMLIGGPLMWPILAGSLLAVTVVVQKGVSCWAAEEELNRLQTVVMELLKDGRVTDALEVCRSSRSCLAPVFRAGLMKFGAARQEAVEAMESAARMEMFRLEKGLGILGATTQALPLVGVLGTVLGVGAAFHAIQLRAAAMNPVTPGDIAGGIWQALITTAASLVVAVPAMLAHSYFVHQVRGLAHQMEQACIRLADMMTGGTEGPPADKE